MPATNRVLLRQRPLDAFYLVYFAFHILTFICIDGQNFYPEALVPATLKRVMSDYLRDSGDPFVKGLQAGDPRYTWFATSMYSSLVFQNPVFVAGIVCLWRDDKRIYPVMAAYASLALTTTGQCLAHVLYGDERLRLSAANVSMLLASYIPFVVIPGMMLFDTLVRSAHLIGQVTDDGRTKRRD